MKQLKFLMVAFTLLMGVSLTSCLSDDAGESMYDGIGYVRTKGNYFADILMEICIIRHLLLLQRWKPKDLIC